MYESSGALPIADRRTVARRAAALVRQFRGRLAAIVLVHAGAVLCGLLPPAILGMIVDRIVAGGQPHLVALVGLIAAALAVSAVLAYTAANWAFALGERVFSVLRMDFSAGLLDMPISEVEAVDPGEVLSRSTSDMDAIAEVSRTGIPEVLVGTVSVMMTLGFAFVLNPLVALGCLVGLPFIVFSTRWYVRRAATAYADQLASRAAICGDIAETARGHDVVEAHGLGKVREQVVRRGVARAVAKAGVPIWLEQRWFPVVQLGYHLPLLVVLAWGAYLTQNGYATIGAVAAIALYMRSILAPLDDLIYWFGEAQSATAALGRILGVTTVPAATAPTTATVDARHAVELDKVSFGYGEAANVLTDIDLTVRKGERVCVVGPSGAGKTTLALLLAGVLTPRSGVVRVTGRTALVAQEDHVFHGTVRDNLTLADIDASDIDIWSALRAAGADGWVGDLDTALGGDAYEPTPAQARQLSLARLFLNRPDVLLLDEATAALSDADSRRFETALATALPGSTVVQVAHDLWAAEPAERVIVMDHGDIVESGTPDELLARDGCYAHLYRAWRSGVSR
jgi:ABC-type multidrug transport system fused ATPase/permease subunit